MADDNWLCDEPYGGETERDERFNRFFARFCPLAIATRASSLRGGQPCTLSPKYSLGNFNYVRKVTFTDGVAWVARVRMPPWEVEEEEGFKKYGFRGIEYEAAIMEFVRRNSTVPVPAVHDVNNDSDGAVGFPFLLMDYVDANTAEEVLNRYKSTHGAVPEHLEQHLWKQLANIMITLASIRAPLIGTVLQGSTLANMRIGPLAESSSAPLAGSNSGPYKSSSAYFDQWPLALGQHLHRDAAPEGQHEFIQRFRKFARQNFSDSEDTFGLRHMDLSVHNLLVDEDLNILAVIDWDSLCALPRAALHQIPVFMGMDVFLPRGISSGAPSNTEQVQRALAFARTVEMAARNMAGSGEPLFTVTEFFDREGLAYMTFARVSYMQGSVNLAGIEGLDWMDERPDAQIRTWLGI